MSTWRDGNRKKKKYIWQKKTHSIQFNLHYDTFSTDDFKKLIWMCDVDYLNSKAHNNNY
jgi:hypothetical protein